MACLHVTKPAVGSSQQGPRLGIRPYDRNSGPLRHCRESGKVCSDDWGNAFAAPDDGPVHQRESMGIHEVQRRCERSLEDHALSVKERAIVEEHTTCGRNGRIASGRTTLEAHTCCSQVFTLQQPDTLASATMLNSAEALTWGCRQCTVHQAPLF